MHKIGYAVKDLVDRYINQPVSAANKDTFLKEFIHAGGMLGDRIKREERICIRVWQVRQIELGNFMHIGYCTTYLTKPVCIKKAI
jgi:hypothetical protein